jgi:acyl-coenzyme A synthetase/AMP-(fatty) acid ligase
MSIAAKWRPSFLATPAAREVAVFGIPDQHGGELVDASVVLKPGMNITEEALSVIIARASRITKFPAMWSSRRLIYRNVALANY